MLRTVQRVAQALRQQAAAPSSLPGLTAQISPESFHGKLQPVQAAMPCVVRPFQSLGLVFQHPQPVAERRGELDEPETEVKMNKNADKPDAAKRFDQGHVEPDQQAKADSSEQISARGYMLSSPSYTKEYVESVVPKHKAPGKFFQTTGLYAVTALRWSFDKVTGYGPNMNEQKWMTRVLFLETIAGVPGMVGAMLRHLRSLRSMKRDHGWIHTLLEEAENERMHLLTFLAIRKPNWFFRTAVLGAQGVFFNLYTLFYMMSPRHCHAFVGYLEEEAVKTYTHCLHDIDTGKLEEWRNKKAPEIAINYWDLDKDATMRDVILAIRADEASHSHVNHTFSEMKALDHNPFSKEDSHIIP